MNERMGYSINRTRKIGYISGKKKLDPYIKPYIKLSYIMGTGFPSGVKTFGIRGNGCITL